MKRVILHHIFKIWQESWSQQLITKLHSVKPVIGAWPVIPMRRTDVKLTRLRIGHTCFTFTSICCWGVPLEKKTASVFDELRAIFHTENQIPDGRVGDPNVQKQSILVVGVEVAL
ncbi:hypothetical protein TNCV_1834751 [Trichonephila clavipes]|nr:hypothetical protein TNCV_1834751 [Trichonephila clavipes]